MGLTWSYATQYIVPLFAPLLGSPYAGVTEWMSEGRVSHIMWHMVNNCPDTVLPDCDLQRLHSNVVNLLKQSVMNHAVTKSVHRFFSVEKLPVTSNGYKWMVIYKNEEEEACLTASLPGQAGQAGTWKLKPVWILMKQEMMGWQWHQLDHMCKSFAPRCRQITTPAPVHAIFCRPGALPDAQPTVSRHWMWFTTSFYYYY